MIVAENLSKHFGDFAAVDGVSFSVERGELYAFLGPNGAGKSTTIDMLCTLSRPTGGRAWVDGHDVVSDPRGVRRRIGLVFQDQTLDDDLTAEENLRFHGALYSVPATEIPRRTQQVLELVGLRDHRGQRVRTMSGGMARRLEIARALLHQPQVLYLDEPTIGLDPQTRVRIWEDLRRLQEHEGVTVFLTTHYMDEADIADRVAIIDAGRIVAIDTPSKLKAETGQDTVRLETLDDARALECLLASGVDARSVDGGVLARVGDGEAAVPWLLVAARVPVQLVRIQRPTMDDVFLHFTGHAIREQPAGRQGSIARMVRSVRRR